MTFLLFSMQSFTPRTIGCIVGLEVGTEMTNNTLHSTLSLSTPRDVEGEGGRRGLRSSNIIFFVALYLFLKLRLHAYD